MPGCRHLPVTSRRRRCQRPGTVTADARPPGRQSVLLWRSAPRATLIHPRHGPACSMRPADSSRPGQVTCTAARRPAAAATPDAGRSHRHRDQVQPRSSAGTASVPPRPANRPAQGMLTVTMPRSSPARTADGQPAPRPVRAARAMVAGTLRNADWAPFTTDRQLSLIVWNIHEVMRAYSPFGMPRTMSVPLVVDTQNRLFWRIGNWRGS
jgi:hypothetical protein